MVAMSDFSTFSQMTCDAATSVLFKRRDGCGTKAYWDAVRVLLTDALCLGLEVVSITIRSGTVVLAKQRTLRFSKL